ncbi:MULTISPECIES: ribbon-helix-helix protein, CopG family [Acinetobacter]|uniref:ribbon-helix-helix protein, CopG family n=1 Tax=Acinetobacter TaxID=469 RepID=UPI0019064388|nr:MULTISPECIES: ribbon-helix-helix protein, CopG family [Acinetobacter]MBJ9373734.1 CopG family transcriptional regulator [Acinetobacter sp. TGL-Y2]MDV8157466.1 ribbon-helix-helix protein, CopG family [Acinetobacter bereziniae]
MSKQISPFVTRPRSKKINGGRVRCVVYLPKEEVDELDAIVEKTDMSRSSLIAQTYFVGKQAVTS